MNPRLIDVIASALAVDVSLLSESSDMENTEGWDSLKQLIVVSEVERVYGVNFSFEQMTEEARSVASIRNLLASKGVAVD